MQDVQPPHSNGHSIQDIHRERSAKSNTPPPPPPGRSPNSFRSGKSRIALWAGSIIAVFLLFILVSNAFSGTRLVVTPKSENITVSGTMSAVKQAQSTDDLQYEIMTVTKEARRGVPASGEEEVSEKASGQITIFNEYSEESQKLIATTRFESPEGHIYRIDEGVTVPGYSERDGQIIPGSITATVFADKPGEEYNTGLVDFTIPGFEGDPQYEKFYARSVTPMEGGYTGIRPTVKEEDKESAIASLEEELKTTLLGEAESQKPDGFVFFKDGSFLSLRELPTEAGEGGSARVGVEAILKAVIFDKVKFANYIAKNALANYDGGDVEIVPIEEFEFALENKEEININENPQLSFTLNGEGEVIWLYDETTLRSELIGQEKGNVDTVLSQFAGIERADLSLSPFWKRKLPKDADEIVIVRSIE